MSYLRHEILFFIAFYKDFTPNGASFRVSFYKKNFIRQIMSITIGILCWLTLSRQLLIRGYPKSIDWAKYPISTRNGSRITVFFSKTIIEIGENVNLMNHFESKWGTVCQFLVNCNQRFMSIIIVYFMPRSLFNWWKMPIENFFCEKYA